METTSFFPGLIALLLAALLGFLAAWIWRSKQLAAAQTQAARLRRERREMTAKMTQASRKFNALSQQRTKAVDALSTLKQQHQALETGHAQLIASYSNLKQSTKRGVEPAKAESPDLQSSEDEWFDGIDGAENASRTPAATTQKPESSQKQEALQELEAFEQQLSSVSEQLVRENQSAAAAASDNANQSSSRSETDAMQAQIARQEAEIDRLREQMAPLLGLPLAVSTREAERDRLADVLQAKEHEITSKDELLARKEKELATKQREIATTTRELEQQTKAIAENQKAFDTKLSALEARQQQDADTQANALLASEQQVKSNAQEISELNAALRQRAQREATLNRELAELNAAAKRTEETHREALRRAAAAKVANAPKAPESGNDAGKLGNLGREVKDSSSTTAQSQKVERTKPGSDANKPVASTVQPAPLGSTVAVKDIPAKPQAIRSVNGSKADVAAVQLGATHKKQAVPRQYERAPTRVDNLKEIKGIGPVLERMLNRLGVYQFSQIAAWSDDDIAYFDDQLADFRGRIRRDDWPAGAAVAYDRKYA